MKKQYIILLFSLLSLGVKAQQLSLDEYRERVFNYNQDIKQSQQSVDAAIYSMKAIKTGFFPKLSVSGNYSYQLESIEFFPGTNLKHDNYGAEAALTQNVYSGSAVNKQYKSARIQEAIARLGQEYTVENILYAADVNYWTALANRDLYQISSHFVNIVEELYNIVKVRFDEGGISKTDLLMVQTRLKEAQLQRTTTFTNYQTALQGLNIMMGAPADAMVTLPDSTTTYEPGNPMKEIAVDSALAGRADYQMAGKQVELANSQIGLVRSGYMPQVIVGLKERYGTTMLNVDGKSRFTTTAFAQVSIPVFSWGERRQKVKMTSTQVETKLLEQSKLQDQINKELNNSWTNLEESANKLDIVLSTLDIAQENLTLNTYSYNEGKLPILDVLSAQVSWLQTYTNVVSVNYQFKLAQSAYIKAVGGYNEGQ
ncbi:MAG: TolC family protein [Marinifilaceae bacterium]